MVKDTDWKPEDLEPCGEHANPHTDRTKVNPAEPLSGFGPTEPFGKVLQPRSPEISVTGSDATLTPD